MSRTRGWFHKKHLDDFSRWCLAQGFAVEPSPHAYEVVRIYEEGRPPAIIHEREKGEHFTTHGRSTELVSQWFEAREVTRPWS